MVEREEIARIIYERAFERHDGPKPAWVPGGNSLKQDDARHIADLILARRTPIGNGAGGSLHRLQELLGGALLAEQRAENAFAPEGRTLNRRRLHNATKLAWSEFDAALEEVCHRADRRTPIGWRERLEGLADEWERKVADRNYHDFYRSAWQECASELRAMISASPLERDST